MIKLVVFQGLELFSIDLDAYLHVPTGHDPDLGLLSPVLPPFKLSKKSNCLSIDMDGNFLCVSDTHQVRQINILIKVKQA